MTYRSLARVLMAPLLLGVLCLGSGAAAPRAIAVSAGTIQGDVNCSGAADAADSLQILVGFADSASTASECGDGAGDVDCDGDRDVSDAMRILRFAASLEVSEVTDCVRVGDFLLEPPTSEDLIAAALETGDITYEQSLLYRAYALFADPRLPAEYQSQVMNWEAGTELFGEIDANEGQISAEVLADLEPFLVRPNDPASIHYDTPETQAAPQGATRAWRTSLVAGTNARVWALGPAGAEQKYVPLMAAVWPLVVKYMGTPNPDQVNDPNAVVNPDTAIDFYFVNPGIDPRFHACEVNPNPASCLAASDDGMARRAAPIAGNKASGYLMVNAGNINSDPLQDDNLVDTIAHEMAHVSQYAYDTGETSWLYESTATWVAYRAMLDLGREPEYAHDRARDLYNVLDKPLTDLQGTKPKYRSWLFFQHLAMATGDDGVAKTVWNKAKAAGANGINAVNEAYPLEDNFEDFTVRNWNKKPPLQSEYRDADILFPHFAPDLAADVDVSGEADYTLSEPIEPLSAQYYHYSFGDNVRHIIFENNLVETPRAHVWLLKKISGDWKPPENMEGAAVETWCRDSTTFDENLEELVVVVSNSEIASDQPGAAPPQALSHPSPRVIADQIACKDVEGTIRTTLHIVDDNEDITYDSGNVAVRFTPKAIQDVPGDVQYVLSAQSHVVNWSATGTYTGCPASGAGTAVFTGEEYTGLELTAGYLVVIAPGDRHASIINAYPPPGSATVFVTCPGDPPFEIGWAAGLFLQVLNWPNSANGTAYTGDCTMVLGSSAYHFVWDLHVTASPSSAMDRPATVGAHFCDGFSP